MKRRAIGFVTGILAAFLFVKRARSSYAARQAARTMSDAEAAQMYRELDNTCKVGEAPAEWLISGNMMILLPNLDPDNRVWFSKN